ncbi:MAG: 1-deoxy-D-xylulose-5-phosphate reductoisomerase [Phycisphaeraceae bacterium]|nr:1-deoxy-D-xylulose-5-phosphate reductoisomerase [Phycisphaeraceae bacterium]
MTRQIAILGSTGSIGKNALRVIASLGSEFQVVALSAHSNVALLAKQAHHYRPKVICLTDESLADSLVERVRDLDVVIWSGSKGLTQIAEMPEVNTILSAVVGAAGLPPALAGARLGKRLAIANKEPLVMAGELLTSTAKAHNATLVPVDSEHSAVFQAMHAGAPHEVQRVILTASGGPFRQATRAQLQTVTREQALAHPTWDMGPKITIDSATMMNKALEIIEAHWLFGLPVSQVDVLIHPESIVHSLVEFVDGAMVAQLGTPDMCLPIQYALTYPKRLKGVSEHLRLEDMGRLTFELPNHAIFRALPLAYQVAQTGGTAPAVFNAANEAAVEAFLNGDIEFVQILDCVDECLNRHDVRTHVGLDDLIEADLWARTQVRSLLK